ncbi:carbohydrate kinase [Neptunitalea chrysea]|uniref:Carbohydrate kinase n=1 Tax=Neptunitalea chrysea TaxID=1647581 RepID=A0A9W6EVU0_9FLAO|nr:FGGY family carbohydrate kinase [Neptunitalea chrysea]GLB51968.1 carbohydrate kinase [Neptunitalea chrysea]
MYFLGIDLGSSSVKLSVFDAEQGNCIASVTMPESEMEINAPKFGWAEQDPELWWQYTKEGIKALGAKHHVKLSRIKAIGIAYQMHGLVLTDANLKPIRPAIIWCDSRAAVYGSQAYQQIGEDYCQNTLLGSPGNFTAAKLKWVQEHQPEVLEKAAYMMLPGDFIAAKLSGIAQTTASGLSEATLWNFKEGRLANEIMEGMQLPVEIVPEIVPNFGEQAKISHTVANELGFSDDVIISYRGGDQPNNALSLNTLQPGEIATTAGTSAVIYAVSDKDTYDKQNRVNTFLHINNSEQKKRNGVMVCINGSGILYQWLRKTLSTSSSDLIAYEQLNQLAQKAKPGSKGLRFYPFGNGVERIFNNKSASSGLEFLNFNMHHSEELVRSACEGIVFALNFGFDIMKDIGVSGKVVRAGKANLFLSPVFREIFVNTTNTSLELYNTSGAEGAARGAAYGAGYYASLNEAFSNLEKLNQLEPTKDLTEQYQEIYSHWKNHIKTDF